MKPLMKTTWWAIREVTPYLVVLVVALAVASLLVKVPILAMTVAIIVTIVLVIVVLCFIGILIWSCFMSLREYYLTAKKVEALKEANKKEEQR